MLVSSGFPSRDVAERRHLRRHRVRSANFDGPAMSCTRSLRHAVGWHSLARTQVTDLSPQHIPDHWSSGDVKSQERSQAQGPSCDPCSS